MAMKYALEIAPIVFIKSDEPVYADRVFEDLRDQFRAQVPGAQVTRIDAQNAQPGELLMLTSPSLFGEPRAIYIPNLEQANTYLSDEIIAYLPHPEPDVCLILRHNGGQRGKKLKDAITKQKIPTIEIKQVKTANDKARAVQDDVTQQKRAITPQAVNALVDALGSDLRELLAVTNQLLSDVSGKITEADVARYCAGRIEATGYQVADAVVIGDVAKAVQLARHAIATGLTGVAIVAALAAKFRNLAYVLGMRSVRIDYRLSLAPWQIDRAKRELRGWSAVGLGRAIQEIARADADLKGGSRDSAYALERALLAIGRARRLK
ncbi:DNA polymerase III subunit delta [Arcanobacterium hippocoleae]|uniref:DNA-directed DNA polymerase n=1 Tax=Arcanobacterium hippocoleae TaxID=149017 RepID=A0ABU1T240_9ACTO|nr:DNA polymerase III subunit delta [Arcanobacterium hippocoleae]MDR6938941.1 DNA polymerase-3 subunit delta [Arcanobacterium hippocoleae]